MKTLPASNVVKASILTVLAMLAFAGNSILCRLALKSLAIDPASFTSIRVASGAIVLGLVVWLKSDARPASGNWLSAFALCAYATGFSFAYVSLTAATGALLLFGAVQVTMIGRGVAKGESFSGLQITGISLAFTGLIILLLPGLSSPPLFGASLMVAAGIAWGVYSLRGSGVGDPTRITAGNFICAVPIALIFSLVFWENASVQPIGVVYAIASGALTSGIGYAIWYAALPLLKNVTAASVQLSVPVLTAIAGVIFLNEPMTLRLVLTTILILGGIALVITKRGTQ